MKNNKQKRDYDFPNTNNHKLLFRIYRWIGWDRTHVIMSNESTDLCRRRLKYFTERHYVRAIKTQTRDLPYEFQLHVSEDMPRPIGQGAVFGRIVAVEDDHTRITLRGYPDSANIGCSIFLTCFSLLGAWGVSWVFSSKNILESLGTGILLLALIAVVWRFSLGGRDAALKMTARSLAPSAKDV